MGSCVCVLGSPPAAKVAHEQNTIKMRNQRIAARRRQSLIRGKGRNSDVEVNRRNDKGVRATQRPSQPRTTRALYQSKHRSGRQENLVFTRKSRKAAALPCENKPGSCCYKGHTPISLDRGCDKPIFACLACKPPMSENVAQPSHTFGSQRRTRTGPHTRCGFS